MFPILNALFKVVFAITIIGLLGVEGKTHYSRASRLLRNLLGAQSSGPTIGETVENNAIDTSMPTVSYDLPRLFIMEYNETRSELLAWIKSKTGEEAINLGFYDQNMPEIVAVKRFWDSKCRLKKFSSAQSQGNFSTDTPFSLATQDEFEEFAKNDGLIDGPRPCPPSRRLTTSDKRVLLSQQSRTIDLAANTLLSWPARNQKSCASCWAFAIVSVLELTVQVSTGRSIRLSDQQIVNCASTEFGCSGGDPNRAVTWLSGNANSFCDVSAVPYTGVNGQCTSCPTVNVGITGVYPLTTEDEAARVITNQRAPFIATVNADSFWMSYKGGVVRSAPYDYNHAVVITGLLRDPITNTEYWVARNSWSSFWGLGGSMNIVKGNGGVSPQLYVTVS